MLKNHTQSKSKRLIHLDLLRLLAIYLVIFNHTGDRGFTLFIGKMDSPISLLYMIASVFCKIAVPLFFMISGALLLRKEETLKELFLKRILRMVSVLCIISILYYFWLHRSNGLNIIAFISFIYGKSATTSLWYLYSYIGLLLMMPFLRSMVKNMQQKDFVYLICCYIVLTGILPCLEYLFWRGDVTMHESFTPVLLMSQSIFYALIGYYIEHILDSQNYNKRNICIGIAISIGAIILTCGMVYYRASATDGSSVLELENYFNCFICVPTITIYYLIKYIGVKCKLQGSGKWISIFGSAVFGVYLIEKFTRALTNGVYNVLAPYIGSFSASLIWCFSALCLAFVVVIPMKHIPFMKKIVNKFI